MLVVIDGLGRELFDRALAEGRAPTLAAIVARGTDHGAAVSAFPSLTPVCLSAIATGRLPDGSWIPGLTWFRRGEDRFVEYGSSFGATLVEGSLASINDSIMNLNHLHLSTRVRTLFEVVEDAGLVAGSINFFVFRGRKRHPFKHRPIGSLARAIGVFDAAYGPSRFFFGELFASDRTGAPANLGIQGRNDVQAAAIGRWLVARDGFDFLVYYLPEVDMLSHRVGPDGALDAVEAADHSVAALIEAGGGLDSFLARYGLVVLADHGQVPVNTPCDLHPAFADLPVFVSSLVSDASRCAVAIAASNRAAMIYRLADAPSARALALRAEAVPGVDVVAFREDGDYVARRAGAEVRFARAPDGADAVEERGGRWRIEGDHGALDLVVTDGLLSSATYPNAPERLAGLLDCVNAGEVVLSAGEGVEFLDGGGSHHLGGGSHGSLHAADSLVPLVTAGMDATGVPAQPAITDAYGLVLRHLGLQP